MLKKSFPAFICPSRSTRRRNTNQHQFDAYQRLTAIYLLRLILGLQKSLKRVPLLIALRDDASILTGLDEHYVEDETNPDNNKKAISFNKASKRQS